jgi:type IV secretion system protein VirD4
MRVLGYLAAGVAALLAAFLLWEAAFALAVAMDSHSWALWQRFTHGSELLLPAQSAMAEWGNPAVKKTVGRASLGATLAFVIVSAGAAQIFNNFRAIRAPKGGARLATAKNLKGAGLLNGRPGYSIFLGRFNGADVRYSGPSHIYVNGPTRSGKGVGFVLANALEWLGSLIGLDIKREMWAEIGAARAAMGQRIFMFSPGSPESHCWNPLDLVSPWPERATDVTNIARSLIATPATGDAYWAETARGLFAGLLGYVLDSDTMRGRRTIKSALKMMSRGQSLAKIMGDILIAEPNLNEFVVDKFRQHIAREDKQRMSFEAHITTALDAWNNELVDKATSRSDFNIADLRRMPFTILIGTPVGNFGTVEAVIRLLVQQVHDVLLKELPGLDEPHKLLLMLDEFYQFGRMPEIVDRAPLVAGYGFQIAVIAQGLTQMDVRYGRATRDMLIGNMDVKLLIGVGDDTTAKYCAEEVGKHWVRREGWGTSVGGAGFIGGMPRASRSTQGRWELEPLMTGEELRRLDSNKSLLLVRGHYAAVIGKINFFKDAGYKRKVAAAAAFKSRLSIPAVGESQLSVAIELPAASSGVGSKHDAALARVMAAAEDVFGDCEVFRTAFVTAMNETRNEPIADLCRRLRTEAESFGPLKRRRGLLTRPGASADATRELRAEIVSARNALNADRAEKFAGDDNWESVQGAEPRPETTSRIGERAANEAVAVAATTGSEPVAAAATTVSADVSGMMRQAERRERVDGDVLKMTLEVKSETEALRKVIAERLENEPELRGKFEGEMGTAGIKAEMFVDTPDDLRELI